jgi:predicted  nucleic acid-binding Zn-ribbon protein
LGQQNVTVNRDKKNDLQREISNIQLQITQQETTIAQNTGNGQPQVQARVNAQNMIKSLETRRKENEQRIYELNQELMDISSREGRLKKVSALINIIRDDQNLIHVDEETLKSLINSLDLTLYKPIFRKDITQQTNNNLASNLAA